MDPVLRTDLVRITLSQELYGKLKDLAKTMLDDYSFGPALASHGMLTFAFEPEKALYIVGPIIEIAVMASADTFHHSVDKPGSPPIGGEVMQHPCDIKGV